MIISAFSTFIMLLVFICIEIFIYTLYLLIKALRIYIKSNEINEGTVQKKKSLIGCISIAIINVLIVAFIIMMPYIQRKYDTFNTKNVIICNTVNDVEKFSRILEDNNIGYKILHDKYVKMQNEKDFDEALNLVQENCISFSIVNEGR